MKIVITESQMNETLLPFLVAKNAEKKVVDINRNKAEIVSLLQSTNRRGIDNVIAYLEKSRYFTKWGSYRHHKYRGGLAEHSLGVCKRALRNSNDKNRDSVIICSLLHDIGKLEGSRDTVHSLKSAEILERLGLELTAQEKNAIQYHTHNKTAINAYNKDDYKNARKDDLSKTIHNSDFCDAGNYNGMKEKIANWTMNTLKL